MTQCKLNSKLGAYASDALTQHVPGLYANLGKRIVGVVELAAVERTTAAPDEDKEASVTLQIKHMEVANVEQEDSVRQALRALYTLRTAYGKLTEADDIELSEETLKRCAGEVTMLEAARLHVAIEKWSAFASKVLHDEQLSASALRRELKALADGLLATIYADVLVKG